MANRLDISRPCASCNLCIGHTRGICRAGVDLGESRLSLVPSFLNDQKILEQTGESFIPWHTMLPSLSCDKPIYSSTRISASRSQPLPLGSLSDNPASNACH